jgi:hypothetical protein
MMLAEQGKFLIERLRAQTSRTKTAVMAITSRVPIMNVNPYLIPYISAESKRMKTAIRPYFIVTVRKFFSGLKNIFAFIFISNCHDDVMITSTQHASSLSWRWILKIFLRLANRT